MRHRSSARQSTLATAVVAGLIAVACGGSSPPEAPVVAAATEESVPAFGLVSPAEAAVLADDETITVIDVRTPEEFEAGHVDGAAMIDFYADTFADEIADLDPTGTYLIYCRSGNRSGQTSALMADLGIDQVYDLNGGILAWEADGRPVVP